MQIPERIIVQSGLHVQISGQYVESDVHINISGIDVTATVNISGKPVKISGENVWISGQHVFVGSGIYVTTQPEIAVSGTISVQSGVYLASGIHVVTAAGSGQHVQISGQHIFVESGIHVIGDFTTEVASGLYVVQSLESQLKDYFISDIDEATIMKFYGYLNAAGGYYIMRETSGNTYRYASSGYYASNWIDRSGPNIIYQRFDIEF